MSKRWIGDMQGNNIGVRNGLLEQKHFRAIGNALWLYIWLIDKQPRGTSKILGGRPITYEMFATSFAVSRRTYANWLRLLAAGGYIAILRTPNGLSITIEKPKKWTSDVQETAHPPVSDVQNFTGDVQKSAHARDVQETAHAIKTNSLDKQRETNITNVMEAKPSFGNSEVNQLFDFWGETIGWPIKSQVQKNRNAAYVLITRHGLEGAKRLVTWAGMAHGDRFAKGSAKVADFIELRDNDKQLYLWAKGKAIGQNNAAPQF